MREAVGRELVLRFMEELGRRIRGEMRVYLVGGASAVLHGWREQTIDVDLKAVPDGELFQCLPAIKEALRVSVETASPEYWIPELPGWEARSEFIDRIGVVSFYHLDFYSQALAKVERGFDRDLEDVRNMLREGFVQGPRAIELFASIEPALIRYPAIDPAHFRAAVHAAFAASDEDAS